MATTLAEILQARGDADYAQGGEGGAITEPDYTSAAANEYLQHAADLTFNAHRYLADQHDRNMQEELKGINNVDFKDLLPQDSQALMPEYSESLKDVANNFGVIRNPLSNPQQYAALKAKESGFRQKLSQAQQDAAFLKKQAEFVQVHPEFNTPAYQENVKKFMETPVGQRQPFVVTPPLTFNPAATYKTIAELAKKKYANAATNGKYITQEEGEKTDPTQYNALATGPLAGVDQYGNSLETARKASFDSLPANIKAGYKDYNDYVTRQAAMYMPQDQVSKKDIKTDEFGTIKANYAKQLSLQKDRQAFDANEGEKDRISREIIAGMREGKINQEAAAEGNLRTVASIIRTGNVPAELAQKLYGDNNVIETKIGKPDDDGGQKTEKMPTMQFVNSGIDRNGNIHIYMKDNRTGKMLENAKVVSYNELLNDLNNSYGTHAPAIQGEISKFSQKNFGKATPSPIDILNHFNLGTDIKPTTRINSADKVAASKVTFPDEILNPTAPVVAPASGSGPAQIKSQTDYDALPKGAQYIDPTDGKPYIKQ